jgi:DNA-binding NtrC family response regulator
MNGVELARKVHAKNPAVPVIIVTGYGPIEAGKEVTECLEKQDGLFPALIDKIKVYLDQAQPTEAKSA